VFGNSWPLHSLRALSTFFDVEEEISALVGSCSRFGDVRIKRELRPQNQKEYEQSNKLLRAAVGGREGRATMRRTKMKVICDAHKTDNERQDEERELFETDWVANCATKDLLLVVYLIQLIG
jgi:hypothetical protein